MRVKIEWETGGLSGSNNKSFEEGLHSFFVGPPVLPRPGDCFELDEFIPHFMPDFDLDGVQAGFCWSVDYLFWCYDSSPYVTVNLYEVDHQKRLYSGIVGSGDR